MSWTDDFLDRVEAFNRLPTRAPPDVPPGFGRSPLGALYEMWWSYRNLPEGERLERMREAALRIGLPIRFPPIAPAARRLRALRAAA